MKFSDKDADTLWQVLQHRRDVRGNRFTEQDVSDETMSTLIQAALTAPSVGYSQPWQFVVIRDQSIKHKVYQSFEIENQKAAKLFEDKKAEQYQKLKLEGIVKAPVNLAVLYDPAQGPVLGQTSMPEMGRFSVVCAIQNLWLMARAMNLGVGWVSILQPEEVKSAINAPQNSELIGYLCIGHVTEFLDQPELKTLGWEQQKVPQNLIFNDRYPNE